MATHLGVAFRDAGCYIKQIYSRHPDHASVLAKKLMAEVVETPSDIAEADLLIMAVSDDVIEKLVPNLDFQQTLVVHTSGSVGMVALKNASTRFGVLYPLQTFSKNRILDLQSIPFLLEANKSNAFDKLRQITGLIGKDIRQVNSEDRLKYHLSAVIANNFTNQLLREAQHYLDRNKLDFEVLHPLIRETVDKALELGPDKSQTGPAKRNDQGTIRKHIGMLDGDDLREFYKIISHRIRNK